MDEVQEIRPNELREALESYSPPRILDVREEDELENGVLPNAVHIPLGQLTARYQELDPKADWVVVCRSGVRSERAIRVLLDLGFENVWNLIGGMNGYAHAVDPTMKVY